MKPTTRQLMTALRVCSVDEPQEINPCEYCYLYHLSKDGRMPSSGETCFQRLASDVIDVLRKFEVLKENKPLHSIAELAELYDMYSFLYLSDSEIYRKDNTRIEHHKWIEERFLNH